MAFQRTDHELDEALVVLVPEGDTAFFTPDQLADYDLPHLPFDLSVLVFDPGERMPRRHIDLTIYTEGAALAAWEHFLTPPVVPMEWPLVDLASLVELRSGRPGRMVLLELAGPDGELEDGPAPPAAEDHWLLLVRGEHTGADDVLRWVRSVLAEELPETRDTHRAVWDMLPAAPDVVQAMAEVESRIRGAYHAPDAEQFVALRDEAERIHFEVVRSDEDRRAATRHVEPRPETTRWRVDYQALLLEERAYAKLTGEVPEDPWVEGSVGPYMDRAAIYDQLEEPWVFVHELAALERHQPHLPELPIEAAVAFMEALVAEHERFDPSRDGGDRSW